LAPRARRRGSFHAGRRRFMRPAYVEERLTLVAVTAESAGPLTRVGFL